jgi:hypothetical protein
MVTLRHATDSLQVDYKLLQISKGYLQFHSCWVTIALRTVQSHYKHIIYGHDIFVRTYLNFMIKGKELIIIAQKRSCWPARSCIETFCELHGHPFSATGHAPLLLFGQAEGSVVIIADLYNHNLYL